MEHTSVKKIKTGQLRNFLFISPNEGYWCNPYTLAKYALLIIIISWKAWAVSLKSINSRNHISIFWKHNVELILEIRDLQRHITAVKLPVLIPRRGNGRQKMVLSKKSLMTCLAIRSQFYAIKLKVSKRLSHLCLLFPSWLQISSIMMLWLQTRKFPWLHSMVYLGDSSISLG